ncbi:MAG: hypothetical protein GKR99_15855 [Rhodobacteraceae bacterium]|nr:hypothetical protein [Paracoccaceae bacterium]
MNLHPGRKNHHPSRLRRGTEPGKTLCTNCAGAPIPADCVEKLRNQSVADFLRKPMKRNSRKALTTRQRMAARERM